MLAARPGRSQSSSNSAWRACSSFHACSIAPHAGGTFGRAPPRDRAAFAAERMAGTRGRAGGGADALLGRVARTRIGRPPGPDRGRAALGLDCLRLGKVTRRALVEPRPAAPLRPRRAGGRRLAERAGNKCGHSRSSLSGWPCRAGMIGRRGKTGSRRALWRANARRCEGAVAELLPGDQLDTQRHQRSALPQTWRWPSSFQAWHIHAPIAAIRPRPRVCPAPVQAGKGPDSCRSRVRSALIGQAGVRERYRPSSLTDDLLSLLHSSRSSRRSRPRRHERGGAGLLRVSGSFGILALGWLAFARRWSRNYNLDTTS